MTISSDNDYKLLLDGKLREFMELSKERDALETKLIKLRQFIYATINMLPEEQKAIYQSELAELASQMGGLTDSIRETLKLATQRNTYFTATEVRDHLRDAGFDFSQYSSNPLASVNTILRRFKPGEVESVMRDGVAAYRWIVRFPRHADGMTSATDLRNWPVGDVEPEKRTNQKLRSGFDGPAKLPKKLTHPFRPGTYVDTKKE